MEPARVASAQEEAGQRMYTFVLERVIMANSTIAACLLLAVLLTCTSCQQATPSQSSKLVRLEDTLTGNVSSPMQRLEAADELAKTPGGLEVLARARDDQRDRVRLAVARALANSTSPVALDVLTPMINDPSHLIVVIALSSVRGRFTQQVFYGVRRQLDSASPDIRALAVDAMASYPDPEYGKISAMRDDESPLVRRSVYSALARWEMFGHGFLEDAAKSERDPELKQLLHEYLSRKQ